MILTAAWYSASSDDERSTIQAITDVIRADDISPQQSSGSKNPVMTVINWIGDKLKQLQNWIDDSNADSIIGISKSFLKFRGIKEDDPNYYQKLGEEVIRQKQIMDNSVQIAMGISGGIKWAEADVPIANQLVGKGQLRDLRANPNLKGVNIDSLLTKTPAQLEAMAKNGEITNRTLKQIKKAFEGRDLGKRGKN